MKRNFKFLNSVCNQKKGRQGGAMVAVLIIMGLITFVSASLLRLGVHEMDMSFRRQADIEVKHVVESALEVAMAKLAESFKETQSITTETPDVTLSTEESTALLADSVYTRGVRITRVTNQLLRQRVFIDAEDPDTLLDPHRGAFVNVSEWDIEAEATVEFHGKLRTVRAVQSFQVRESPFFTHAIFYNMDLEFHPGPRMIINGPVHTNGTVWLLGSKGSSNGLYFLDKVSATKGIRVGTMSSGATEDGQAFQDDWSEMNSSNGSPDDHGGKDGRSVWFNTDGVDPRFGDSKTLDGVTFSNLYDGSGDEMTKDAYLDSLSEDSGKLYATTGLSSLSEFMANRFNGNLVAGSEDAPVIKPQFVPEYVAEDGTGIGMNSGYSLIEPLMAGSTADGGKNPYHKGEAEKEKFAYKAGLTLQVVYSPDAPPAAVNAVQLVRKGGDRDNENHLTDYYLVPRKTRRSNAHNMDSTDTSGSPSFPVLDENGDPLVDESGDPVTETVQQVNSDAVYIDPSVVDQMFQVRLYREDDDGKPKNNGGLYDQRRRKPLDLVEMNMNNFRRELVEAPFDNRFDLNDVPTFLPENDYNGVVYVEFPVTTTERNDGVVVARDAYRRAKVDGDNLDVGLGLLVSNAARIPDPSYNRNKAPGFTLATNGTAYIKGNYNADGDMGTGSSSHGEGEASRYNRLAAIAADSITFLSDAFRFDQAKDSSGDRRAENTEVNAALMAGIVPTNKPGVDYDGDGVDDLILSGGSHNYPRFLENWGGKTFRYRGSMVAFFESEIAVEPQLQFGNRYYSPPRREYGFFETFGTGSQPPGTPMGRTFFKLDFRFL